MEPTRRLVHRALARLRAPLARGGQRGSAVVEFIFLAVLMGVPLFYLVVTLARVQAGAYAVTAAAREGGRAFVTAPTASSAGARAATAAQLAFAGQGFDRGSITVRCDSSPCLTPEGHVRVEANLAVPLPLVPDLLAGVVPARVPVSATHVESVGRFTSEGNR